MFNNIYFQLYISVFSFVVSSPIIVQVDKQPQYIHYGDTVILSCSAIGNPKPSYSFKFRVSDFKCRESGFKFPVGDFKYRVSGFKFRESGFKFWLRVFKFLISATFNVIWNSTRAILCVHRYIKQNKWLLMNNLTD